MKTRSPLRSLEIFCNFSIISNQGKLSNRFLSVRTGQVPGVNLNNRAIKNMRRDIYSSLEKSFRKSYGTGLWSMVTWFYDSCTFYIIQNAAAKILTRTSKHITPVLRSLQLHSGLILKYFYSFINKDLNTLQICSLNITLTEHSDQ